ncbi:MAG: hypothetical protein ABSC55_27165 [Syntrophorhabdales bacterium]
MPALPLAALERDKKEYVYSQVRAYAYLPGGMANPARITPHSSRAITLKREVFHKYRGFRDRFVDSPYILR